MGAKNLIPEAALVAYLVGVPLAVMGAIATLILGGVEGAVVGASAFVGGILFVCTGMIVSMIDRR